MRVLLASAASWFGCIAVLYLYFSAYLQISSLTIGIFKSLRMSSFLTYHGTLTIVLNIFELKHFTVSFPRYVIRVRAREKLSILNFASEYEAYYLIIIAYKFIFSITFIESF